ncbi:hypothetical protein SAMD00019534_003780 [Acytostelium subglobosum LB1]|uniref:hypothetical protein n=1 Tax=Acytostelium subglobosum LB1 TaxID=1410327 RepID=UPI0006451B2E|nr:hypothetical protein SAMD00019534_003780 [Acytostelium subglobosum LB1]GAM17203.1 hypothetical protein SAMD00019534_003780 [Acytostelium subglobosum LB1]|eukprot:XP_012759265.1 hypothetical protein SAMD00019534_003780 [Acytostelium subglobosum LB1]
MVYYQWQSKSLDASKPSKFVYCYHGLVGNAREYDTLAQDLILADPQRVVICPDVPGRGASAPLLNSDDYDLPVYAQDALKLIAATATPGAKVDFLGTSMGALIGMTIAMIAKGDSPIQRFVFNDTGPYIPFESITMIGRYLGHEVRFNSFEEGLQMLKQVHAGFGNLSEAQWNTFASHALLAFNDEIGKQLYKFHYDTKVALNFAKMTGPYDLWEHWPLIASSAKFLVIRGEKSPSFTTDVYERMIQHENGKGVIISGVGHAPPLLSEDQTGIVSQFFN